MFNADELVLQTVCFAVGVLKQPRDAWGRVDLLRRVLDLGRRRQPRLNALVDGVGSGIQPLNQLARQPFRLLKQCQQHVFNVPLAVLQPLHDALRGGDCLLGLFGESVMHIILGISSAYGVPAGSNY